MLRTLLCVNSSWLWRALEMFPLNVMVTGFCSTPNWHTARACWLLQAWSGFPDISKALSLPGLLSPRTILELQFPQGVGLKLHTRI